MCAGRLLGGKLRALAAYTLLMACVLCSQTRAGSCKPTPEYDICTKLFGQSGKSIDW